MIHTCSTYSRQPATEYIYTHRSVQTVVLRKTAQQVQEDMAVWFREVWSQQQQQQAS